jgi:hypothetical protein
VEEAVVMVSIEVSTAEIMGKLIQRKSETEGLRPVRQEY